MNCSRCQQENPARAKFCLECGSPVDGLAPCDKSYADLNSEIDGLRHSLDEAVEQQAATAELLKVIGQSASDLELVFTTLAENAVRLCQAEQASIFRFDGQVLRAVVIHKLPDAQRDFLEQNPLPLGRGNGAGRAAVERRTVHIHDVQADPEYTYGTKAFFRTLLAVPMFRATELLGAVCIQRDEVRPFTDNHIALMETFADQAAIAIENVRLFNETKEALEQQTATSEILSVISRSPTDIQPVFDTIVSSAVRLCGGLYGFLSRFDGEWIHVAAQHNYTPEGLEALTQMYPMRPGRLAATGRAILTRAVVHIEDALNDPEYARQDLARAAGWRSMLAVPMLREGNPIGAILVIRGQPGPFAETQIQLLKTFADQAVIAIENAGLLSELRDRTAELTRSVGELKALGEVGRAVSSTLDLRTVLDTIVTRAVQLSGTGGGFIYEYDDATEKFHLRATHRVEDELADAFRAEPIRLGEGATGRAAATRAPVQITDILDEKEYTFTRIRSILARLGYRSVLAVPLLVEERVLGALVVQRHESGTFAPEVVNLLQTFATQSALALQNARLFREIEKKSRELEVASQHKSEFLANMSHELRTPLNAIIGFSEVLSDRMFGELNEKQEEYLRDIYASGTHLLSLINDILDLSKIEAGRMELELTDFHLPMALENALTLVRERAGRRNIALHTSIDNRLGEIQGDERKIRQVVLNLLPNAIKFTPEGGRIEVTAVPKDGFVEVSVSDTGIGIAPEDQEAVFEEFRQVGTAEKKAEGTGLGLTLCRKFVELHGGRIRVKSEVGMGSAFSFTLPVRRGE